MKYLNSLGKMGYEAVFFFLGIGFLLLLFWPQLKFSPMSDELTNNNCFKRDPRVVFTLPQNAPFPDPSMLIQDPAGISFDNLMKNTPMINKQVEIHFNKLGKAQYKGKERQLYSAWFNLAQNPAAGSQHVSAVNYATADGVENLLFVDVTEDQATKQEGLIYLDVYVKKTAPIPNFIVQYCQKKELFDELYSGFSFIKDQDGNTIPPLSFKMKDLKNRHQPTSCTESNIYDTCTIDDETEFYLFAYGPRNFAYSVGYTVYTQTREKPPYYLKDPAIEADFREKCPNPDNCYIYPTGDLEVMYNNEKKFFRFEWFHPAASRWAALFDLDNQGPLGQVMFYYAPAKYLGPPTNPGADLANPLPSEWDGNTLQLRAVDAKTIPSWGWWTPECKPAIYLYPKTTQNINVKVKPQGLFKYTDPIYDLEKGWNVKAYPSGKLEWLDNPVGIDSRGTIKPSNFYDYLYYESKIPDSSITKPTEGYVVKYEELETFYRKNLPVMGLNEKEIEDYIEFWQKALPKNDYYFVGIVDPLLVNVLEPIKMTPSPDNVLRVRLYYEGLTEKEAVDKAKNLKTPQNLNTYFSREGFSVVEWGGFVKQDKDHPFTCSM